MQGFDYLGEHAYHVTMRSMKLTRPFENITFALTAVDDLKKAADSTGFRLLAYCLMPDHVHLLVQGENETADLKRFVSLFKQRTGFAYKQQTQKQLWQVSYFDRALRRDEDLQTVADYIFQNPVNDGLSSQPDSYPLSGGVYFDAGGRPAAGRNEIASATADRAEAAVPTSAFTPLRPSTSASTSRRRNDDEPA